MCPVCVGKRLEARSHLLSSLAPGEHPQGARHFFEFSGPLNSFLQLSFHLLRGRMRVLVIAVGPAGRKLRWQSSYGACLSLRGDLKKGGTPTAKRPEEPTGMRGEFQRGQ